MLKRWLLLSILVATTIGCKNDVAPEDSLILPGTIIGQLPDPNSFVCDPFDIPEDGEAPEDNGVLAHLYYLTDEMPAVTTVGELIDTGVAVEGVDLYFNQIDIPTLPFDRGFVTEGGVTLVNDAGDALYEYFALDFNGRMQITPEMAEGNYQLMILADDGAILDIDIDGELTTIVDNDGTHPTRMKCATEPVEFKHGEPVSFNLKYHQGPRYHIALKLMWRPWPENPDSVADPLCGRQGNSLFFDSTQDPPEPMPAYNDLLGRNWSVVENKHLLMPADAIDNPCNTPAPVISNLAVTEKTSDQISLSWTTDIGATSQVKYVNALTGDEFFTPVTADLRVSHVVDLTGLQSFTVYNVTAISTSGAGLVTESQTISVRTEWAP